MSINASLEGRVMNLRKRIKNINEIITRPALYQDDSYHLNDGSYQKRVSGNEYQCDPERPGRLLNNEINICIEICHTLSDGLEDSEIKILLDLGQKFQNIRPLLMKYLSNRLSLDPARVKKSYENQEYIDGFKSIEDDIKKLS